VQIKAVTFDVGGTLIEPWPSVGHVYAGVAARHGMTMYSAEQLNERFKAAWRSRRSFQHTRQEWAALVEEVFHGATGGASGGDFFAELYERFAGPDAWRVFEDVEPALKALISKGIRLGVISNWDERLGPLLRGLKLDLYFETLTVSWEVGSPKPAAVIFQRAARDLDLPAGAILHVGDSLELDVEGARAAGFRALRIDRSAAASEGVLHSFGELPARIEKRGHED
jgi:putative hydrolase of the HAD superfamily